MRISQATNVQVLQVGLVTVALGLLGAPWLLDFDSQSVAAWSAWSLSPLYLAMSVLNPRRNALLLASALLALGLWTLLAPGMLAFDLSNAAAFWTHTIAGLFALRGSYLVFCGIDSGGDSGGMELG